MRPRNAPRFAPLADNAGALLRELSLCWIQLSLDDRDCETPRADITGNALRSFLGTLRAATANGWAATGACDAKPIACAAAKGASETRRPRPSILSWVPGSGC